MHPFKKEAHASHKSKAHSMGKANNLVIPVMRAAGENKKGGIHESSASEQHRNQAAADGMKRGGKVKALPASPPSAKTSAAGAVSSAAPAPFKRGGMGAYPLHKHGSNSGLGRMDKAKAADMKPIKEG